MTIRGLGRGTLGGPPDEGADDEGGKAALVEESIPGGSTMTEGASVEAPLGP